MSRRTVTPSRKPAARKRGPKVPVILYLIWPLWGPIVIAHKRNKTAKKKAEQIGRKDLAAIGTAIKTGNVDKLVDVAGKVQAGRSDFRAWHYKNRRVMYALEVAAAVAASKLLILLPAAVPSLGAAAGAGMLIFAGLFFAAPVWLLKLSRDPLPELTRRVRKNWPLKVRATLARLSTPQAGGIVAALVAVWWWGASLERPRATLVWIVAVVVVLAVRAWRFQVRAAEIVSTTGTREGDWGEYIAAKVNDAKGSVLQGTTDFLGPKDQRLGWTGGVILPKGSAGATVVAPQLRARIATTYSEPGRPVGLEDVMVERFYSSDGRADESRFVVTVLDEGGGNAVRQTHLYAGSTFDPATGIWRHGWRADWKPALIQLYDVDGTYSIHFSGSTGAGKSEGLITMMHDITSSGVVAPYVIDIGAATFGDWRDRVEVFVDNIEDAAQILVNADALREHRKRKRGKMRRRDANGRDIGQMKVYPVGPETPVIPGVFDEWSFALDHPDWGKPIEASSEAILTQQRKELMPLIAAGQATSLQYGFKNNSNIRTQFQAGAMVAYRNNSDSGRQSFGGLIQVDPSTIQPGRAGKGVCFVVSNIDQRDAMVRAELVDTPVDFYGEVNIPQMPSDEIDILTRGLSIRPTLIAVRGLKPDAEAPAIPAARKATPAASLPPARPEEAAEPTAKALDDLIEAIVPWLREVGPTRRKDIVDEFGPRRKLAESRTVDKALQEAKRRELVTAKNGVYSALEVALDAGLLFRLGLVQALMQDGPTPLDQLVASFTDGGPESRRTLVGDLEELTVDGLVDAEGDTYSVTEEGRRHVAAEVNAARAALAKEARA